MSLDWFEFHPKSFLTDTMRLNTEAKGAYLLLLLDYYEKEGPAPDDDDVLAAITGLPLDVWQRHRKVIQTLFQIEGGFWHHSTCAKVIIDAHKRIETRKRASAEANKARWNKHAERTAPRTPSRSPSGIRNGVQHASVTDTERNASGEPDFGPSVTAPPHSPPKSDGDTAKMPDASVTESVTHSVTDAGRTPSDIHSNSNSIREGANAPSPAREVSIGSLLPDDWKPAPEAISIAKAEGVSMDELAGWLDSWKARCAAAGARLTDWDAAWSREYHNRMLERAKAKPKPRVSVTKRVLLKEIPEGWQPNARHHEIADERNLDIAACIESFGDHIVNKKHDWSEVNASFRNWLKSPYRTEFKRGQASQRRAPAPGGNRSITSAVDRLDAAFAGLAGAGGEATEDQPHGGSAVLVIPPSGLRGA